jgi:anti-sigma factor RsiW
MMQDWKEDSMSHVDEGTLHAYLDGELPSGERTELEAHLAGCATCRANLAEERALRERATAVLGSARPAEHPAPPLEQLRREPKRSPWRVRRSFAWAASIALALGIGYYMSPSARVATPSAQTRRIALDQNRDAAAPEDKAPARPQSRVRASERRAANVDEVAKVAPRADTTPAQVAAASRQRVADSLMRIDARSVSGALAARAEPDRAPPTAAANIVIDGAPAPQPKSTTWPVINRRVARSILGEEPVGLPGLATRAFRRAPGTDGTVVVEQVIDSSTVIQIFQRPAYPYDSTAGGYANEGRARVRGYAPEDQARERGNLRFGRFVKGLRVEITGPLSADSLNRLLEQVAPLPPLP